MARFSFVCAMMLLSSANALAPSKPTVGRRQLFGIVGSAVTAAAVMASSPEGAEALALKVGPASPFSGDYEDPNHPGCLRQVKVVGAPLKGDGTRPNTPIIEITGYDGSGKGSTCTEADRPSREQLWKVQGKLKSNTVASIDFSSKGGPANLVGTFDTDGIVFPDGNKWTKIDFGTPKRRPIDMRTLKSE
uniref:Uncharacterized protein n=1 Tax=Eucampia antarctica TaxID=49252 RepID=A0A7S2R731_9STRA|mmetsp:Transcript_17988/g.17340  ORF Transcript_17988/g.17340 Transcript_17988/m.17340 type:complete len:190 (+) Transcript_17988:106-675(+)|eukprot:CAMPEP_0197835890 /NCGR_PEP_ID=MMETSP1437-20131217/27279_1 /TAXON_ID=49252 ORGANISM="Eucampia antarctica, Strain CCMP1452" /NCGR_SAMPLE_ID=MMETSP1437 /ASSEMBLY_ACC=CAM_ASM_001096 /LENGTH=189 /DNA_ID=CAMNT_0043441635 /DNA_START=106 /DNA_END=675 /DNA_ORIENTATION=+